MLTDATGRERTVVETLEAGDYEVVLAMFRWHAIPADVDAPRIAVPQTAALRGESAEARLDKR